MSSGNTDSKAITSRDGEQAPGSENLGGVFRLDALSPGSESGDPSFSQGKKGKLSTHTLFLAILLASGVGIVYGMRVLGVASLRNFATAGVPDYDISKTGVNKTLEHKKAIEDLKATDIKTQVPPDEVQKNPFKMADALSKTVAPVGGADPRDRQMAERLRKEAEARRKRIADALSKMKVNSILGGPKPVARVDGDFVRIGDTLEDFFTVKAIQGRTVELECDGETYTLTMDDDANDIHKAHKR